MWICVGREKWEELGERNHNHNISIFSNLTFSPTYHCKLNFFWGGRGLKNWNNVKDNSLYTILIETVKIIHQSTELSSSQYIQLSRILWITKCVLSIRNMLFKAWDIINFLVLKIFLIVIQLPYYFHSLMNTTFQDIFETGSHCTAHKLNSSLWSAHTSTLGFVEHVHEKQPPV